MSDAPRPVSGLDIACAAFFVPVMLAVGIWTLDAWGLEQWTADTIGNFVRLVVEASQEK